MHLLYIFIIILKDQIPNNERKIKLISIANYLFSQMVVTAAIVHYPVYLICVSLLHRFVTKHS